MPPAPMVHAAGLATAARVVVDGLDRMESRAQTVARPETRDELWDWVRLNLGISIPRRSCCFDHSAPFDAFATAYFAQREDGTPAPVVIWKGSRGLAGKSFMLAALSLTEAATMGAQVTALGGSGEQSANVVNYIERFMSAPDFPNHLLAPKTEQIDVGAIIARLSGDRSPPKSAGRQVSTLTRVRLSNGGNVVALTASTRSTRGPHPQRLRIDEVDEVAQFVLDSALGQPMTKEGVLAQTVLSSTHHYPDGTMSDVLKRAESRPGWHVFEWCFKESLLTPQNPTGWLAPSEVDRTQETVPARMWAVEYELQEPAIEGRAIMSTKVDAMFDRNLGEYDGDADERIVLEPPRRRASYVTGVDWAKDVDWTIIWTVRVVQEKPTLKLKTVAWSRTGRRPWADMIGDVNDRLKEYPGFLVHDATSAAGSILDEQLTVPADRVEPFVMVGARRRDLFTNYIKAIEAGTIETPMIVWSWRNHKFATWAALFTSAGHTPDDVVAGALVVHGASNFRPRAAAAARKPGAARVQDRAARRPGPGKRSGSGNWRPRGRGTGRQ